jgi:hypothetical protein
MIVLPMEEKNHNDMNLEQQIKRCEEHIAFLEESKRAGTGNQARISKNLEEAYTQAALLKIRKSMIT